MRWLLSAIGVLVLSVAISVANERLSDSSFRRQQVPSLSLGSYAGKDYRPVSLVGLLADPQRYDGQKVRSEGYVSLAHEQTALYLDKTAYEAGLARNAVWIDAPRVWWTQDARHPHRKRYYGEVAGVFIASETGHMGAFSGALTQVRSIVPSFTMDDVVRARQRNNQAVLRMYALSPVFLAPFGWAMLGILWLFGRIRSAE